MRDDIVTNLDMVTVLLRAGKEVRHVWMQGSDIEWHVIIGMREQDSMNVLLSMRDALEMRFNRVVAKHWVNARNFSLQPEGYWALT